MYRNTTSNSGEEPPSHDLAKTLKEFRPAGRGFWANVPDADWNNWHWQLKHRITTVEQLERLMPTLSPEEAAGAALANHKLALAITPYFFNLIDPADENCPIRWQVIPREEETHVASWEMTDPCGEDSHSPVPGLVHRYPDRVLFLVTDRCAAYCRYCTRSRLVSNASGYDFHPEFPRQIEYIRRHPEVRDVLLSGGDPLLFNDEKLEHLLSRLRSIPHVEFLRIGTRIPVFLPQRITPELCAMLRKYHPLFISIHSNHPRELTTEVRDALGRLAEVFLVGGSEQPGSLRHHFPLGRGRKRDPQVLLQFLQAVEGNAGPVLQESGHGRRRLVVLRRAHPVRSVGRVHPAAGVAAKTVQLVDRGRERSHPPHPHQGRRLGLCVHLALITRRAAIAGLERRVRHFHLVRPVVGRHAVAPVPGSLLLHGLPVAGGATLIAGHVTQDAARRLRAGAEEQPSQPIEGRSLGLQLAGQDPQGVHRRLQLLVILW